MKVNLRIYRFNPETDQEPHYDAFEVEADLNDRILDCLNKIRWEQDSTLSYRMSCGHGICGSDALNINGIPALACQKLVKDYDCTKELVVEPLKYFPVLKDLTVDMRAVFQKNKRNPARATLKAASDSADKERLQTPEERAQIDDAIKCILCGCCVAACPVILEQEPQFIGPAAILREEKYIFDSRANSADTVERMG